MYKKPDKYCVKQTYKLSNSDISRAHYSRMKEKAPETIHLLRFNHLCRRMWLAFLTNMLRNAHLKSHDHDLWIMRHINQHRTKKQTNKISGRIPVTLQLNVTSTIPVWVHTRCNQNIYNLKAHAFPHYENIPHVLFMQLTEVCIVLSRTHTCTSTYLVLTVILDYDLTHISADYIFFCWCVMVLASKQKPLTRLTVPW